MSNFNFESLLQEPKALKDIQIGHFWGKLKVPDLPLIDK